MVLKNLSKSGSITELGEDSAQLAVCLLITLQFFNIVQTQEGTYFLTLYFLEMRPMLGQELPRLLRILRLCHVHRHTLVQVLHSTQCCEAGVGAGSELTAVAMNAESWEKAILVTASLEQRKEGPTSTRVMASKTCKVPSVNPTPS